MKLRKLFIALAIILLVFVLVIGAGLLAFQHYYGKLTVTEKGMEGALESFREYSDKDVTNILLIGVDNDYAPGMDDLGNADGLIIVSINKNTKQIVLSSLMRDIYVSAPGVGNTKLTLAYHYGGTETLIETIETNFNIPIDNYVLLNYLNLIEIVDAVGGLTLDVTADELYWMESKIKNLNELRGLDPMSNLIDPEDAGRLELNGVQVAAFMRIRMAGNNDFERTERARTVLLALKDKALEMNIAELNELINAILPCITTDMSQSDMLPLILGAPGYLKYEMVSNRIPLDDTYYFANYAGSVVVIDYEVNNEFLRKSIYEGLSE